MKKQSAFLLLEVFICVNILISQTMNIQTQKGTTSIKLSDIVNITFIDSDDETVIDIDGNTYKIIKIGNQVWMAENLKVTHYRNGEAIPNITDSSKWLGLTTGAYCDYNNNLANVGTYGRLYNWFAMTDSRGVAPLGWHVPNPTEWETLIDYLGGYDLAGGKMKEVGYAHWSDPNTGATNESGFSGLPAGLRGGKVDFDVMNYYAFFWSSANLWFIVLSYDLARLYHDNYIEKTTGFSIRCIQD